MAATARAPVQLMILRRMQCNAMQALVAWQGERAWVPGIFSIDGSLKQTRPDVRGAAC